MRVRGKCSGIPAASVVWKVPVMGAVASCVVARMLFPGAGVVVITLLSSICCLSNSSSFVFLIVEIFK